MKPRLAVVIHAMQGGGVERCVIQLAARWITIGYEVDVVLATSGAVLDDLIPSGVRMVDLGAGNSIAWLRSMRGYMKQEQPDAVFAFMEGAGLTAIASRIGLRKYRPPVCVSLRNHLSIHVKNSERWKERHLTRVMCAISLRFADARVAVSRGVAEDLRKFALLRRQQVEVIYNPIPIASIERSSKDQNLVANQHKYLIVASGRLTRQKNFTMLLMVAKLLKSTHDISVVIVGDGPELYRLNALSRELGVEDVVEFRGFVLNPFPLYAAADVFVMCSRWEGFGNVLVEALACGTPVVSTDCPSGPAEIIDREAVGRLVEIDDHEAMAKEVIDVLANLPDTKACKERAAEFDVEKSAASYLATLNLDRSIVRSKG